MSIINVGSGKYMWQCVCAQRFIGVKIHQNLYYNCASYSSKGRVRVSETFILYWNCFAPQRNLLPSAALNPKPSIAFSWNVVHHILMTTATRSIQSTSFDPSASRSLQPQHQALLVTSTLFRPRKRVSDWHGTIQQCMMILLQLFV